MSVLYIFVYFFVVEVVIKYSTEYLSIMSYRKQKRNIKAINEIASCRLNQPMVVKSKLYVLCMICKNEPPNDAANGFNLI